MEPVYVGILNRRNPRRGENYAHKLGPNWNFEESEVHSSTNNAVGDEKSEVVVAGAINSDWYVNILQELFFPAARWVGLKSYLVATKHTSRASTTVLR